MTLHITIKSIPLGAAPARIRRMWVGVTIPTLTEEEHDVLPDLYRGSEGTRYTVLREKAVTALAAAGRDDAVRFWSQPGTPLYIQFSKLVCETSE